MDGRRDSGLYGHLHVLPQSSCLTFHIHFLLYGPLPSIRHHVSYDDCLEDKTEDYQNCSVLSSPTQLCNTMCTLYMNSSYR